MEKPIRISIWFLLTLLLFFQAYHQHQLKGVENEKQSWSGGFEVHSNSNDGIRSNDPISKIEAHNKRQDNDILDLKNKVKKLENLGVTSSIPKNLNSGRRKKRPARLLPESILRSVNDFLKIPQALIFT